MEQRISRLDDLMNGAMTERFNRELEAVMRNIQDPNTDPKAKRKITIALEFTPNERRDMATLKMDIQSRLAASAAISQAVFLHVDDDGNVSATEVINQLPGQTAMDGAEQALPKVLNFGRV